MTQDLPPAADLVLANARLVLGGEVVTGSVRIAAGRIADIATGSAVPRGAVDCGGAYLVPGLVELHTDNLEKHLHPRPGVVWPGAAAVIAHDGELASTGITTVFDAIRVGSIQHGPIRGVGGQDYARYARGVATEINRLAGSGVLRIDHRLHLRAEVCSETVLEEMDEFSAADRIDIVSIMDHTPGARQFADMGKYRQYYQGKYGLSDDEMARYIGFTQGLYAQYGAVHEAGIVARARGYGAALASHDDTTPDHVATSAAIGVDFAEFPTSLVAARGCHAAGIPVMMGAPNILRGGSHSGNVAAMELAADGVLDILSSDYAPSSLLMGAMKLGRAFGDLPRAIAMVSRTPAQATGLADRGEIAVGLRADLVRVVEHEGLDIVNGVWSAGRQVG